MLAYMYYNHMGWGWGLLMSLGWLLLLGLFLAVLVASLRDRRNPSAKELLDRRLASGEISVDDYERAAAAMSRGDSAASGPLRPPDPAANR
jgi:uncharacterized membrane protein